MAKYKAVFLDRDGVINELVERSDGAFTAPWSPTEFRFKPYVREAVNLAKNLGFKIIVATNQPSVLDGYMTEGDLDLMNKMVRNWLGVDDIVYALDRSSDFYKPNNGMIEWMIQHHNIDRYRSYMVGDRWKDIVPGYKSQLTTVFVGELYKPHPNFIDIYPDFIARDVYDAVYTIAEVEYARI